MINKKQSLYIPCYNCEKQIVRVLNDIDNDILSSIDRIIAIDNKSVDQTISVIREFVLDRPEVKKKFILIEHKKNYGLGASFKTAIFHASLLKQDYMYWLHGDDQANVEDLKKMIRIVNDESPSQLFGARFMKNSDLKGYSSMRNVGNRFLNAIFSFTLAHPIYELGSGLNAFRVNDLPLSQIKHWPNHIAFDVQLLFHFCSSGRGPRFFPIQWREEDQKSNAGNISTAFLLLKALLDFKLNRKPPKHHIINQEYTVYDFTHTNGR